MEVTVAEESKLKRKLTVEVPLSEVSSAYDEVYGRLRSNIRVRGFRPGKFPRHLAEKRFKDIMAGEALQTLVPKYFDQALQELHLRPATEPHFDNLDIDKERPFKFDVEFEVIPDFELIEPSAFTLEEKEIVVEDKDVDERIESLRRARASLEDKGEEPADTGDVVTFDFEGLLDGEPFEGSSAKEQRLELGSSEYLPDFHAQFEGVHAGEHKAFPLTFPEDYGQPNLAGKTVQFDVQITKVERRVPPELNAEFFAQFGQFDNEQAFREHIHQQLQQEREHAQHQEWQNRLGEQIRERYDFEVPESLVEQMLHEFEHELSHRDPEALKDADKLAKLKEEELERIRGGLRFNYVVDALASEHQLSVEPEEVRQRFYMQAYLMRQNPSELLKSQYGQQMLYQIERNALTARTLDHLAKLVLGKPLTEPEQGAEAPAQGVAADAPAQGGAAEESAGAEAEPK